jgi:hypothetical protein
LELAGPVQPIATIETAAARTATTAIRGKFVRVAIAVTLDKEEQERKIALFGMVLLATTAAAAAAADRGFVPRKAEAAG